MTTTTQTFSIPKEDIQAAIDSLSVQNRTMIRLLLLQYQNLEKEDIEYMATDQPDSRFMAGGQPTVKPSIGEAIREVGARAEQYRKLFRQKRERPSLQIECLKKQMALTDSAIRAAEGLLTDRFHVDPVTIKERKKAAISALPKPEIRRLNKAWDLDEISEEDYQTTRLLIEYQTLLRRKERQQRRLNFAQNEFEHSGLSPLQDHEIAHIWGIPLGSLSGRKVKAMHNYLTTLQSRLEAANAMPDPIEGRPDLWRETIRTLSQQPVERSVVSFIAGIERTEELLLEKLKTLAEGEMPEELESSFWQLIARIHDSEHSGPWSNHARSIFALQRLSATLSDLDPTLEEFEDTLLKIITPQAKGEALPAPEQQEKEVELGEQALGVLNAFIGEIDDKRSG
ncbi:hypothetical protein [Candidatus Nitronereus thalassa]|uniref:Uncharacterized protein n=1 Tax=Candidatus Nitronereus thalassa TaxID=3020898 RepID=A0ABU3K4R1_9BACT|nr:hypothetical protein [Candidatus Nitronereus thalassa]MDT7041400.1 hypothetical protein [Candidatus Nitronereus thalassa]